MHKRLDFIDGLRALAVVAVVGFHAAAHDKNFVASEPAQLVMILRQGCHGVDLFFVISGFCLAHPFLARLREGGKASFDVAEYCARRILRIVPPYYAAIVALLAAAYVLTRAGIPLPAGMPQNGFTAWDVVRQALFFDANVRFLNDVFWTLAVEFRWYLLFPFVLWLWVRSPRAFAGLCIVALIASTTTRAQSVDLAVLPTFMLGIVAAQIWLRPLIWLRVVSPVAFVITLAAASMTSRTVIFTWNAAPLWGIAMFWLVVTASCLPTIRAALSVRALTLVGVTSYGIYLVHEPVRGMLNDALSSYLHGWTLWAVTLGGAVAGGMVFSSLVEIPFIRARLKQRALSQLRPAMTRYIGFFRLGTVFTLHRQTAKSEHVRAVA